MVAKHDLYVRKRLSVNLCSTVQRNILPKLTKVNIISKMNEHYSSWWVLFETSRPHRLVSSANIPTKDIYTWLVPQVYYLFIVSPYLYSVLFSSYEHYFVNCLIW